MKPKKVIWVDIKGGDRWMSLEEAYEWGKTSWKEGIETIGYIIENDDKKPYILVAATYDPTEERYHDISIIPRAVLKHIKNI